MNDKEHYYVTVKNLKEETSFAFHGKASRHSGQKLSNSSYFSGDIYFDTELVKNERKESNYKEGLLVGRIDFNLSDLQNDSDSMIWITRNHLVNERHIQDVQLSVSCGDDLFTELRKSIADDLEVRLNFFPIEWKQSEDKNYRSRCQVEKIEFSPTNSCSRVYEEKRARHIENYLLTEFCGGRTSGQIPVICKELSQAFKNQELFNNRNEVIEGIIELINTIKWNFYEDKSDELNKIENSEGMEFSHLFKIHGDEFYDKFYEINDLKTRAIILNAYNNFWKKSEAVKVFEDGYIFNGSQLSDVAEEYLKISNVNSPTLNTILVDGLLKKDICDTASIFQYGGMMSAKAILSVRSGNYVKHEIDFKSKSTSQAMLLVMGNSIYEFLGMLISGIIFWGITSLISGNNELAHYILFGTLFGSSLVVTSLNKSRSTETIKENLEEKMFYQLRDMCHLHKQSDFMDCSLIKNLMYRLEERGIAFDKLIYNVILRHENDSNI